MNQEVTVTKAHQRIWELMRKMRVAMLVTQSPEGLLARPMSTVFRDDDEEYLWFITDITGTKDDEIEDNPRVAVTFSDGGSTHVSVNGHAHLVRDRALIQELWTPSAEAFYPDGDKNPAIIAIRVTPETGKYWDGPSMPMMAVRMAAALITGKSADHSGETQEVAM